jgi:hypothetical protein
MIEQTLAKELLPMAAVQQKHEEELLKMQNVVGVALGTREKEGKESDEPVLSVLVSHKAIPELLTEEDLVPPKIGDCATDVVEVGYIFAGDARPTETEDEEDDVIGIQAATSPGLRRRMRPAPGGFSVGHFRITAGTLGTCCYDLTPFPSIPPKYYILSNNHVLANSNNARIGDPILQPGPADGGQNPHDVIAWLSRFVPIRFHSGTSQPTNYVDAAIAEANLQDIDRQIYWGGTIKRLYAAPNVNDIVQKAGRTTGFTTGKVTNINATVNVNYGSGRVATFRRQIITTNMSAGGDSGSLVANLDEGAVGLLFAGSATRTIVNIILYVQSLLRIRVTEK